MLKKYASPHKLQWVGKAWEIRYALRQELKRKGGHILIRELIPDKPREFIQQIG